MIYKKLNFYHRNVCIVLQCCVVLLSIYIKNCLCVYNYPQWYYSVVNKKESRFCSKVLVICCTLPCSVVTTLYIYPNCSPHLQFAADASA